MSTFKAATSACARNVSSKKLSQFLITFELYSSPLSYHHCLNPLLEYASVFDTPEFNSRPSQNLVCLTSIEIILLNILHWLPLIKVTYFSNGLPECASQYLLNVLRLNWTMHKGKETQV